MTQLFARALYARHNCTPRSLGDNSVRRHTHTYIMPRFAKRNLQDSTWWANFRRSFSRARCSPCRAKVCKRNPRRRSDNSSFTQGECNIHAFPRPDRFFPSFFFFFFDESYSVIIPPNKFLSRSQLGKSVSEYCNSLELPTYFSSLIYIKLHITSSAERQGWRWKWIYNNHGAATSL